MAQLTFKQNEVADILGISRATLQSWTVSGKLTPVMKRGEPVYNYEQLKGYDEVKRMHDSTWDKDMAVKPKHRYRSIELFAGAGGLAIGMERAGFTHVLLNENNQNACNTLLLNRPHWNVVCSDIHNMDFKPYKGTIDLMTGGFPCQAFSYAGKRMGFMDTRGTLFFEYARAIQEAKPKLILGENVRGLLQHDDGRTLETIKNVIDELGYELIPPQVLKAIFYKVPQKRERLVLIGVRRDLLKERHTAFQWPSPYHRILTMRDALKKGVLYPCDVPTSKGQLYPKAKERVMVEVPPGGNWRDLPLRMRKSYMKNSFYLGGGKTGMARRMTWDEPCLTLTCAPAQKQTERCHPDETRPLTIREYARIQTFPDDWEFTGSLSSQYRQIGNAVPVNLAHAVGCSLVRFLNGIAR